MTFPLIRKRRLRQSLPLRQLVAETRLHPDALVQPVFLLDAPGGQCVPVPSMPGVMQRSIDQALPYVEACMGAGIRSFLLFGVPEEKDAEATAAWAEHGVVQQGLRALKKAFGQDIVLMADTCLCAYTHSGHCGLALGGKILNDPSLDILARTAVSQAEAGADIVAPSDMMDGRVLAIRHALDEAGLSETSIMAYSAKYASAFYGPFRDAAHSTPSFGDRRTYQMDPRNLREALEEVALDLSEGADIVMVKPALAYLDVLWQVRSMVQVPVAAYSVSGEYTMVKAAAQAGWLDERSVLEEMTLSMFRAGASIVITYAAEDLARWARAGA